MHNFANKKKSKKNKEARSLANSFDFQKGLFSNEYFQSQVNKDKLLFSEKGTNNQLKKDKKTNINQNQRSQKKLKAVKPQKNQEQNRKDNKRQNLLNFVNIKLNKGSPEIIKHEKFEENDNQQIPNIQILQQDNNISKNFFLSSINNPTYERIQQNRDIRMSINSTKYNLSQKSSTQKDKNSFYLNDKNSSLEASRHDNSNYRDISSSVMNEISQDSFVENKTIEKKIRKPNLNCLQLLQKTNQQIMIEFLNNYGSDQFIGLNEIKIFDTKLQEVLLVDQVFSISDQNEKLNNIQTSNLNNGIVKTNNSKFMFCLNYKKNINQYTLNISISEHNDCQFLVIWNYNQNFRIGVKNCNIYFKNKKIFEGILNKGNEKKNDGSYYTIISLKNKSYEKLKLKLLQEYGLLNDNSVSTKKSQKEKQDSQKYQQDNQGFEFLQVPTKTEKNLQQLKSVHNIKNPNDNEQYKKRNFSEDQNNNKLIDNKFSYFKQIERREKDYISSSSKQEIKSQDANSESMSKKIQKTFYLPQTPQTKEIHFYLLSTWGNKKSIQFNQIQIYNTDGDCVKPLSVVVHDVNNQIIKTEVQLLFRENTQKILKNQNYKIEMESRQNIKFPIKIKVQFFQQETIALIRLVNFYGQRADSNQSIKKMIIKSYPNKKNLFMGYINKVRNIMQFDQLQQNTIFYTNDKIILEKVLKNDTLYKKLRKRKSSNSEKQIKNLYQNLKNQRPVTIQKIPRKSNYFQIEKFLKQKVQVGEKLKQLHIKVLDTWHTEKFKGFANIKFFESNQRELLLGQDFKIKSIDKKRKKRNQNNFDFTKVNYSVQQIQIIFEQEITLAKIKIYQLAKFPVKTIQLLKDKNIDLLKNQKIPLFIPEKQVNENYQCIDLPLDKKNYTNLENMNNFIGFTLEFQLVSTYGDPYYIGLNGIQIYNERGINILSKINKDNFEIRGFPEGVCDIKGMEKDQRKLENLYQGQNLTNEYEDIWLAPFVKNINSQKKNIVRIQFKYPQQICIINIWNYQKTPKRAVKEVIVKLDGQIIFMGCLNNPSKRPLSSIIFNKQTSEQQNSSIEISQIKIQNTRQVLFTNEGCSLQDFKQPKHKLDSVRPLTGLYKEQQKIEQTKND